MINCPLLHNSLLKISQLSSNKNLVKLDLDYSSPSRLNTYNLGLERPILICLSICQLWCQYVVTLQGVKTPLFWSCYSHISLSTSGASFTPRGPDAAIQAPIWVRSGCDVGNFLFRILSSDSQFLCVT